jgi:cation transport ATPase
MKNDPQKTNNEGNKNTKEEHHLIIDGASCASCVTKIEKALRAVKGVKSADMNFAQRSVIVTGNIKEASLITAVEIAGYNAKVDTSETEEQALDEKEKAESLKVRQKVSDVLLAKGQKRDHVLMLAASIEAGSEHPLAMAIVESATEQGIEGRKVSAFASIAGKGVEATLDDSQLLFGNEKLMKDRCINIEAFLDKAQSLAQEVKPPMYFAINNELAAVIAVADPITPDSIEAIKRLQSNGILTGDNRLTAKAIASKVGHGVCR